jgi:hypothetical protein
MKLELAQGSTPQLEAGAASAEPAHVVDQQAGDAQ